MQQAVTGAGNYANFPRKSAPDRGICEGFSAAKTRRCPETARERELLMSPNDPISQPRPPLTGDFPDPVGDLPQDPEALLAMARAFIEAIPHSKALGMRLDELASGTAEISMPYDVKLIGDPATGVIHGGAVSALMDTCCGAAVMCHPEASAATATIDLRIDYMRGAAPQQRITARATCYHVTRSVAFVRAFAYDEDRENPVATATGAFTFARAARPAPTAEPKETAE